MNFTFISRFFSWNNAAATSTPSSNDPNISPEEDMAEAIAASMHNQHAGLGKIYDEARAKELAMIHKLDDLSHELLDINDHLAYINAYGKVKPTPPTVLSTLFSYLKKPPTFMEVAETLFAKRARIQIQYRFHLPSLRTLTTDRREAEVKVRRDLNYMEELGVAVLYEEWVRVEGMVGEEVEYTIFGDGDSEMGFRRVDWGLQGRMEGGVGRSGE